MKPEKLMEMVEAYRMSGGREENHARKDHLMCAFQEIELEVKKLGFKKVPTTDYMILGPRTRM